MIRYERVMTNLVDIDIVLAARATSGWTLVTTTWIEDEIMLIFRKDAR